MRRAVIWLLSERSHVKHAEDPEQDKQFATYFQKIDLFTHNQLECPRPKSAIFVTELSVARYAEEVDVGHVQLRLEGLREDGCMQNTVFDNNNFDSCKPKYLDVLNHQIRLLCAPTSFIITNHKGSFPASWMGAERPENMLEE